MSMTLSLGKTTLRDWEDGNRTRLRTADGTRRLSTSARAQGRQSAMTAASHLAQTERAVAHVLGDRIDEINQMTNDLKHTTSMVFDEIMQLEQQKDKTENSLREKNLPHEINQQCRWWREGRSGADVVDDEVDAQLAREDKLVGQIKEGLQQAIKDCFVQLRALRASKHQLDQDVSDKQMAREIDTGCAELDSTSRQISRLPSARGLRGAVPPSDWVNFSSDNMARARQEVEASIELRRSIDDLICDYENQLQLQWSTVDSAFNTRLAEMRDTHIQLNDSLSETQSEIRQQDMSIKDLNTAIADKVPPLMLTETRLHRRTSRPNIELVRDPVHEALVAEADQLDNAIMHLNNEKQTGEANLRALVRADNELQEDIRTKVNSINIDNQCMQRRQQYKYRNI